MVKEVKELSAELDSSLLINSKVFDEGEVKILKRRPYNDVSA